MNVTMLAALAAIGLTTAHVAADRRDHGVTVETGVLRGVVTDYSVVLGGVVVGTVSVRVTGRVAAVDYDVKNNGRGPTLQETILSNADGLPLRWTINGTTSFGSQVMERFDQSPGRAQWTDSGGVGSAKTKMLSLYVAQNASPWSKGMIARALLRAPKMTLDVLPAGRLRLQKGEGLVLTGSRTTVMVNRFDLYGLDLKPDVLLLDAHGELFAVVTPLGVTIRRGYEGEEMRLRSLASAWTTQRFIEMQKTLAHRYTGPVRIRNVRIFDARTASLTKPVSVVVSGKVIAAVEPLESPPTAGETAIDGDGGVLVPGLYDMHAHLQEDAALLNILAGVTSVRDMGNDNAVLDNVVDRIARGEIGGPRVFRSGFIEGKSPYSEINGILVDSEAKAIDAVRWYAARNYGQIKIYSSVNPTWAPAMIKEAHQLGLRVAGHAPAFSTADEMIGDGYDEITHINQFMLGWVTTPGEDTRTLLRLTAMKRFQSLDLYSTKVQRTIQSMVDLHKVIDPTLGIHEQLTLNRDGRVPPGAADYFSHMPIGYQRNAMKAWLDVSSPSEDAAYRAAWDKIVATVRMLHERGVFMVFGTDTGGSFTLHRELELYTQAGLTPSEILKRATYDSAAYLGQDQQLGSIEKGKLADFFLIPGDPTKDIREIKTIRMVAKDGVFYYPTEIYPEFGITPFTTPPEVRPAA